MHGLISVLVYLESLALVYSNHIANALELLQSCTKLCVGKREPNCGLFLSDIFHFWKYSRLHQVRRVSIQGSSRDHFLLIDLQGPVSIQLK